MSIKDYIKELLLKEKMRFGEIKFKIQDGKIALINIDKSIKPEDI